MGQQSYQTNLASEFYVMSLLYRRHLDAHLTLGNKKSIDIVVCIDDGRTLAIDVKAVAGKMDWLMGKRPFSPRKDHFVVVSAIPKVD